jgi:hypothetical protein
MRNPALLPALTGAVMTLCAFPAAADLVPTTASFFTAPADGTLTFTYEGYSALDTDQMAFAANGEVLFTNKTAALGSMVRQTVISGLTYQLGLHDDHTGDTWSSDPASNWDHTVHLVSTGMFADFHLGATAPAPVANCTLLTGCYFGWEDRPKGSDSDFNDLVFALQFTPASPAGANRAGDPISEPATPALLCAGLLGLGWIMRRRA